MCSTATPPHPSIRRGNTRASRRSSAQTRSSTAGTTRRTFLASPRCLPPMPYALALALWQGVTFALYLWATRAILSTGRARALADPLWLPLVIGFPAVFVNLGHGHNGFLTAALFGAALLQLDRKPVLAGVLFGCIAYKPQFGLLVPIVLVGKRTVANLYRSGHDRRSADDRGHVRVRSRYLERVSRLDQVHARRRARAGRNRLAQDPERVFRSCACGVAEFRSPMPSRARSRLPWQAALAWLWRSRASFPIKAAALADRHNPRNALQPRLRPYAARAGHCVPRRRRDAAWLSSRGEKSLLAALWLVPILARPVAQATLIPLAVPAMLVAFAWMLRRAMTRTGAKTLWRFAIRPLK